MRLTARQAAQLLGIKKDTLMHQINRGERFGPCFTKVGGQWMAHEDDLLSMKTYLESRPHHLAKIEKMECIKVYLTGETRDQVLRKKGDRTISNFCRWLIERGIEA
jgi:hypothetical protein